MTVQTHSEIVQVPLSPEALALHEGRKMEITVVFGMADLETLWGAANERGVSIQELIKTAALEDAYR